MCRVLHQAEIEASGLTLEMAQLAVSAFALELLGAFLDILFPAREHGVDQTGQLMRIDLKRANRRIFTPTPWGSPAWRRGYNRRSALERINARLDRSFGFKVHCIRGLAKMLRPRYVLYDHTWRPADEEAMGRSEPPS